jgi:hypothetical protein
MKRKRSRKSGKSHRRSRRAGIAFCDTVIDQVPPDQGPSFLFALQDLLPSLNGRTVVLRKVVIMLVPSLSTASQKTPITCQVFANQGNGQQLLANSAFRPLSTVNPSTYVINWVALAKQAPSILRPKPCDDTEAVITLKFDRTLSESEHIAVRLTTHVWVFPQESIIDVPDLRSADVCRPLANKTRARQLHFALRFEEAAKISEDLFYHCESDNLLNGDSAPIETELEVSTPCATCTHLSRSNE